MLLCQTCGDKETKSNQDNRISHGGLLSESPEYGKHEVNQENTIRREREREGERERESVIRTLVEFPVVLRSDLLPDYPGCRKSDVN